MAEEMEDPMLVAEAILGLLLVYAASGLLFGLAFITMGVGRVDAAAQGTSFAFRLLILPGVIAFWPLLTSKWVRAHRRGGNP
jgi:hypothetical protein